MTRRWLGVSSSSTAVALVDIEVREDGRHVLQNDETIKLQNGDRAAAYAVLHRRLQDYVRENKIERVVVKASAVMGRAAKLGSLHGAEVRGVVASAAASVCAVTFKAKGDASRNYGERTVDEYVRDDGFWSERLDGALRNMDGREVALLLLIVLEEESP